MENRAVSVTNLAWATSEASLRGLMEQVGEIDMVEILKDYNGRSKGRGFVTFVDAGSAQEAIDTLHNVELDGRPITVQFKREQSRASAPARNFQGLPGTQVYVGNLPFSVGWKELKDHMRPAGDVTHADVMSRSGRPLGCGVVSFATVEDAQNAIETLNGSMIGDRALFLRPFTDQKSPKKSRPTDEVSVSIGNVPAGASWRELKDFINVIVPVNHISVDSSSQTAIAKFSSLDDAHAACSISAPFMGQALSFAVWE